ncbi:MAG TPA: hypothetical protein VIL97_03715, partial [Thermoanaerobaculia bacterium]
MKLRALSCALAFTIACAPEETLQREAEAVPVRTEMVTPAPFQPSITLLGSVRPSETISIATVTGGTLSYPPRFRAGLRSGEDVRQGEVLAFVENESARYTLAEARLVAESAQHNFDRAKN